MRLPGLFLIGTIGFIAISYFEQLPVLGWLGALVSVVVWVTLGRAVAREGGSAAVASAILGASRPEQIEDNVGASGIELGDDVLERIDEALAGSVSYEGAAS